MFDTLNQLMASMPPSLNRGVFESGWVPAKIVARDDFRNVMADHDRVVAASNKRLFYLGMFVVLLEEGRLELPTINTLGAIIQRGQRLSPSPDVLADGLEFCTTIGGPSKALPTAVMAHDFLTSIERFATDAARRLSTGDQRRVIGDHLGVVRKLSVVAMVEAIRLKLGLVTPDEWKLPALTPSPFNQVLTPEQVRSHVSSLWNKPRRDSGDNDEGWTIWNSTNILGKANMIVCWYFDGDTSGWAEDMANLRDGMKLVRAFLRGRDTTRFGSADWFAVYDAIASFPEPDDEISLLRELVRQQYDLAVRRERRG
jgi:hypothetical protein